MLQRIKPEHFDGENCKTEATSTGAYSIHTIFSVGDRARKPRESAQSKATVVRQNATAETFSQKTLILQTAR